MDAARRARLAQQQQRLGNRARLRHLDQLRERAQVQLLVAQADGARLAHVHLDALCARRRRRPRRVAPAQGL